MSKNMTLSSGVLIRPRASLKRGDSTIERCSLLPPRSAKISFIPPGLLTAKPMMSAFRKRYRRIGTFCRFSSGGATVQISMPDTVLLMRLTLSLRPVSSLRIATSADMLASALAALPRVSRT